MRYAEVFRESHATPNEPQKQKRQDICVCVCVCVCVQVPPEIAQLAVTLQKLLLPGNKLRSLPAQLSALTNLQHIDFRSGAAVTKLNRAPINKPSLTLPRAHTALSRLSLARTHALFRSLARLRSRSRLRIFSLARSLARALFCSLSLVFC
jgi:hypothetical protein